MSQPVIRVDSLGKLYRLGERERYSALRDVLARPFSSFSRRKEGPKRAELWAVKNLSFEVREGEVLGLIGRNGAGKSTLLKILSRITKPTEGSAEIRGRVGSLLEVGTGFHPELTGRENVFLNGAILGMSKREIQRKFDEIVAFAEVERFLDTPLKYYSSGMQVRLAFAVAAHLEPEILLIDEVLAVGDIQFQKKCLGKMGDISRQGRTIIFVSHNMAPIRTLCETGMLLQNGTVVASGSINNIIAKYLDEPSRSSPLVTLPTPPDRCTVWIESVAVLGNGEPTSIIETGDTISLKVNFRSKEPLNKPVVGFVIRSSRGEGVVNSNNYYLPSPSYESPVTEGTILCELGELPLMGGSYSVSFWLCRNPHEQHHAEDVLRFTVEDKDIWGNGALPPRALSCMWWPTKFKVGEADSCAIERARQ